MPSTAAGLRVSATTTAARMQPDPIAPIAQHTEARCLGAGVPGRRKQTLAHKPR